jgi:4-carboxymuconolactone decarboxylase
MRLKQARLSPLEESDWSDAQREIAAPMLQRGPLLNIFRTFLRAPEALKAFLAYGGYILSKRNSLPARERELIILRTGFLCASGYEWTQHLAIAARAGLSDEEIVGIKAGGEALAWRASDRALLQACDQLVKDKFITTPVWSALKTHFSDHQCIDAILTIGQYTQVSMFLNTLGVQLDPGQTLDPDLARFEG